MKKITLLFFILLCSLAGYSQLALENFESGVWPPAGWSILNVQGVQQQWAEGSTTAGNPVHSPTHSAFLQRENMPTGQTSEDFLVTKLFTVPANPQLRFWSVTTIPGNQLTTYKVMILPPGGNAADPLAYVPLQQYSENDINPAAEEWNLITLSNPVLAGYIGQQVRLAFVMMGDQGDRWAIDDIEVVTQCVAPTTLAAGSIDLDSASLSWANPSGATQWEIEIVESTVTPTGAGITINAMPYTALNLNPDTCYKYYVRAKCTDTNMSTWAGPFSFCTVAPGATCSAPLVVAALPYSTTNNTQNFGDDFDGSPGSSGCGTTNGYLNGDDVVYSYTPATSGVISIDATGLGDFAGLFVYDDCADIGVNCIGGGTGGPTTPISIPSLSVTANTTYYIVISTWATPQSTPYNLIIQQVNCAPPVGLPNGPIGQDSATLNWTNPSGATSWEVVVQAPGGGIPPGAGTTVTTNTNYLATGLTTATPYEYWVRAACGNGTFSAWAGPYLFNTTICEAVDQCNYSFVITDSWGDGWNNASMTVSQNGITIATLGTGFTTGQGPITVTVPVCDDLPLELFWTNGGSFPGEVGVSILNNYGQTIFAKPAGQGTPNTSLYSAVVDCDNPLCLPPTGLNVTNTTTTSAVLGWTGPATGSWEYYVVEEGGAAPTDADAIATTTNPVTVTGLTAAGNYEFYVRMVCTGAATPTSLWAGPYEFSTDVCDSSLQCNYTFNMTSNWWIGYAGATMVIKQSGATVATIGPSFTTGQSQSVTVPLCTNVPFEVFWDQPGTSSFQVGLNIVNNFGQTLYNMPFGTGTPGSLLFSADMDCLVPACLAPENLAVANQTTTTANLSWAGPATGNWEYYVVPAGDPAPTATTTGVTTTTNPATATGLTAATNYQYYVRVICSPTQNSPWAGPFAFNTTVCESTGQCNYILELTDSFGDGWNGATVTVMQAGVPVAVAGSTFTTGEGPVTVPVAMCPGVPFEVIWSSGGSFPAEVGITMYTPFAEDVFTKAPGTGTPGMTLYSGASASCTPPLCPKPQALTVAEIEETSVEVNWNEMGTATSWEVVVLPQGSPEPTEPGTIASSHPHTITGLTSGTTYVVYVRAVCGGDNGNSSWTGPVTFTTAIENDDCEDAMPVAVNPGADCNLFETGTLTGATSSGVQPTCNWEAPDWDVWYSFVATGDTHAVSVTSLDGTWYYVALYTGDCGTLTEVNCEFDGQMMATGLTAGTTYYVQVYATWLSSPNTSFEICIQTPEPPITVSSTEYTVEELITDVFIDSECATITNIVSNTGTAVGVNGIGYFEKNGSSFPFENGIVLVSGNAELDVPGPNDATVNATPAWDNADEAELEAAVGLLPGEAHDGSSIQFDFSPLVDMPLTFDFIFASEEYGNASFECVFSDAFAFILTDLVTNTSVNLAVLPGTDIPILVTNVHPFNDVCGEANPTLFDQYNGMLAPINFNGQLVPITAISPYTLQSGHPYRMKMMVANKGDHSLSSAVFLLGGSFNLGTVPLGQPMLQVLGNAACDGQVVTLDTQLDPEVYDFEWLVDDATIPGETGPTLEVSTPGEYSVIATFEGTSCSSDGSVIIEYYDPIEELANNPNDLSFCDPDGFHTFNLDQNTQVVMDGVVGGSNFTVTYHLSQADATNDTGALTSPYTNAVQYHQTIYMRIESVSGCFGIKSFDLNVEDFTPVFDIPATLTLCDGGTATITVDPENFEIDSPDVTYVWTLDGAVQADTDASIDVAGPGVYEVTISNTGCTATASTTVTVSQSPSAAISYTGSPYCSSVATAVVTHSGSTGGAYMASNDDLDINALTGEINIAESEPGTYTVTYTIPANGTCAPFTTTAQVIITPAPEAMFSYDSTTFCTNADIATPTFEGSAVAGNFTATGGMNIDPDTGAFDPSLLTAGQYTIRNTIVEAGGCPEAWEEVIITIVNAPVADFSYGGPYCQDDVNDPTPVLVDSTVSGTFEAPEGLVINSQTGQIDLSASAAGEYMVTHTVASTTQCNEVTEMAMVVIKPTPVFNLGGPYNVCVANTATIEVNVDNSSFDRATASYVWTHNGNALTDTDWSVVPEDFGTYGVTVTTADGCVNTQTVEVTENTVGVAFDFFDGCEDNIYSLEILPVGESFIPEDADFTWTGPEGFNDSGVGVISIEPTVEGKYTVVFVTPEGCTGTADFTVDSTSCFVQRGISPGDDGKNNDFDLSALDVKYLSIFNRYGQEVYSRSNYTKEWHGQDKSDNELPTGTYFYSIERDNGETRTGWVYINRQN